jgi:hypothetical protein
MSLINDALKQAQKNQPAHPAGAPPPSTMAKSFQPVPPAQAKDSSGRPLLWVVSIVVLGGIVAAIFLAGRATASRSANETVAAPQPAPAPAPAVAVQPPVIKPAVVPVVETPPLPPPAAVVIRPSDAPRVQGIFYVPGKATAILDGKTVRTGDRYQQYQVKEIAKASVTLVATDGKVIQLRMAN